MRGQNHYPTDILVYTPQEFRNECDIKGTIAYHVLEEGKILYGAEYLSEYAVEARYPGNFSTISTEEAQYALKHATNIKNYIIELAKDNNFPA